MSFDSTGGFSVPNYAQLLDLYTAKAKQRFGDDVSTAENSVVGMWIRTIAWLSALIYQDIQVTELNNYVDQAEGTALDHLGNNYSVKRNVAAAATVELQFTGTPGYKIDIEQMDQPIFATDNDVEFELIEDVTLDSAGVGVGEAVCTEDGVTGNVPANTIVVMVDRIADVTAVTNPVQSGGGADQEVDSSYRQRIHLSMEAQPGPTYYGLYTALYALPGVDQVQIVPNLTMDTDIYGNPAKSLHFYIRGGSQPDIGQAILDNIAAGIQTVGTIKETATDIGGHTHDVFFDAATVVPIYVDMTLKVSDEFNPETSPDAVIQAIKDYLDGLIMGDKIIFTKLYQAIYNVTGVEYAQVTLGRDKTAMGTSDIQLDQFETAIIYEDSDIEVKTDDN